MPRDTTTTRTTILNFLVNIWWTALCCAPVLVLWIWHYQQRLFFGQLLLSSTVLLLPESVWRRFQITRDKVFYERLGVRAAQALTQNGKLINQISGPSGKRGKVIKRRSDLAIFRRQIAVYERYHLFGFVFFLSTMVTAIAKSQFGLATLILVSNIIYNVYPLLIQQYNRLRMGS